MFSINKNSYLQSKTGLSPKILNRSVSRAWANLCEFEHKVTTIDPEINRLSSEQPCILIPNVDITRRPLAFGNLKIKQLRRDLHSENLMLPALNSFCDVLHDPELAYEALRLKVPDRLADLMDHELPEVRERVCAILIILAGAADGAMAIVHNPMIMASLKNVIDDVEGFVRCKAAMLIERVCLLWTAADVMISNGFIELLIDCVIKDAPEIVAIHFKSFESMFYAQSGRDIAFELRFFQILVEYIKTAPDIVLPGALKALGNMLVISEAKKLAVDLELLETLAKLIQHKDPAIYTAAAFVIMFATLKMRAKLQAFQYTDLPGRLVELANNWQNGEIQIYCIKALTNLCEYPPLRLQVYKAHLKQIEEIQAKDADVRRFKDILVDVVSDISNLEQKITVEDVQMKAAEEVKSRSNCFTNNTRNSNSIF